MRARAVLLTATILLGSITCAHADGMIPRGMVKYLENQHAELEKEKAFLEQMQQQAAKGNLLLIKTPSGIVPVSTDDYIQSQSIQIMVAKGTDAQQKARYAQMEQEVAALKARANAAIESLIQDTATKIARNENDTYEIRHALAMDKPEPVRPGVTASPSPAANPNNLSPEELAESPAAPDAQSRTLTVDNTPPPPPDGTPLIEASAQPSPAPRNRDNGNDAAEGAEELVGIAIGVAGLIGNNNNNRSRGNNGGHHGNSNRSGMPPTNTRHGSGC